MPPECVEPATQSTKASIRFSSLYTAAALLRTRGLAFVQDSCPHWFKTTRLSSGWRTPGHQALRERCQPLVAPIAVPQFLSFRILSRYRQYLGQPPAAQSIECRFPKSAGVLMEEVELG